MGLKKMNYFKGELLHAEDFQGEQGYHDELRTKHNLNLHTPGIVKGLDVIPDVGKVTVKSGMAIDSKGREIILAADQEIAVNSAPVDITASYLEIEDPPTTEAGFTGVKQITVTCKVIAGSDPDGIVLAKVTSAGTSTATVDLTARKYSAPVSGGDMTVGGNLEIKGNLTVKGETTVVNTERMQGNVVLGDADTDTVTLEGSLLTGHSSGKLKIGSPVDISGALSVTGAMSSTGVLTLPANGLNAGSGQLAMANGNVGVGTANPTSKLHVAGTAYLENQLTIDQRLFGGNAGLLIKGNAPGNNYPNIGLSVRNNLGTDVISAAITGSISNNTSGSETMDLCFSTRSGVNHTEKLRILANGNVGIGTTDPQGYKLNVNGSVVLGGFTRTDQDEWPKVVWYRDTPNGWDEGIIKHSSARGFYKRAGFGIHIDQTRDWGVWSTNFTPLLGVEGGTGNLTTRGGIYAGNSDLYFTKTDHNHTGYGNTAGYAAIENAVNYGALMILGRSTPQGRIVKLWDRLEVNGTAKTDILLLADKWRLSGVGDHEANDDWLRLKNTANTAYYGGFAASKMWTTAGQYLQSDFRLKNEIATLDKALDKILAMRGVAFKWKESIKGKQVGLIAQEVEQVVPEVVEMGPDGFKGINYSSLIGLLIEAIKEQQLQINFLKTSKA